MGVERVREREKQKILYSYNTLPRGLFVCLVMADSDFEEEYSHSDNVDQSSHENITHASLLLPNTKIIISAKFYTLDLSINCFDNDPMTKAGLIFPRKIGQHNYWVIVAKNTQGKSKVLHFFESCNFLRYKKQQPLCLLSRV